MKKIFSIALMSVMLFLLLSATVSAANVCYNVSGNSNSSKTFYATTNGTWIVNGKVKITQNKGTAQKDSIKKSATYSTYSYFTVNVSDGKRYNKTYKMTGKNLSVTLPKKNTKYKITVSPGNKVTMRIKMGSSNRWFNKWVTPAQWSVSKTKHVQWCN